MGVQKTVSETEDASSLADKPKRRLRSTVAISLGFLGAIAVRQWSSEATRIQMALYTACIILPLFFGFWANVKRRRFWAAIAAVMGIHAFVLYTIRFSFPFRTILTIVPMVLVEAFAMFFLMAKLLGDGEPD